MEASWGNEDWSVAYEIEAHFGGRLISQELQLRLILYYICSVHRINPRLESAFGTYHNLIKYIWIIQSNPIPSNPIWFKIICMLRESNLRASALRCHAGDHWAILPWCKFPVAQIYCMIPKGAKDLPNESKNKFCCVCTTRACVNNFVKFPNQYICVVIWDKL